MDLTKGLSRSMTIWGGLIAGLPAVDALLVALGILPPGALTEAATAIASAAGAILAIWGRVRATKKIAGII